MKTILITGSTDGIGLETAKLLAGRGHHVLLHGRSAAKLETAKQAILADHPEAQLGAFRADFASLEEVAAMAGQVVQNHKGIDVLINNAGVLEAPNPILSSGHDLRFVVNTFAVDCLTRKLLPLIGKEGRVITLSSAAQAPVDPELLAGRVQAGKAFDAYAQSKLAVTMWSRAMALAHPDGPVFVSVNPGSLLASKMVREGFGVAGNDLSIGANILVRAAEDEEFASANGRYFDNDARQFGPPHPYAQDDVKSAAMAQAIAGQVKLLLPS